MSDYETPEVSTIRNRISQTVRKEARYCFMCNYLFCARISEIVGHASPKDTSVARGPRGTDVSIMDFQLGPINEEAAVFKIKTAKRGGKPRRIALPLKREYEPWTQLVVDYFRDRGSEFVFPFTRQKAWEYSTQAFAGLKYPIDRYKIVSGNSVKWRKRHSKPFRTHALRHIRATELIEHYGFDGIDLSIYGGWTLRSTIGVGGVLDRYAHLQWRKYFPKLLKKRSSMKRSKKL